MIYKASNENTFQEQPQDISQVPVMEQKKLHNPHYSSGWAPNELADWADV